MMVGGCSVTIPHLDLSKKDCRPHNHTHKCNRDKSQAEIENNNNNESLKEANHTLLVEKRVLKLLRKSQKEKIDLDAELNKLLNVCEGKCNPPIYVFNWTGRGGMPEAKFVYCDGTRCLMKLKPDLSNSQKRSIRKKKSKTTTIHNNDRAKEFAEQKEGACISGNTGNGIPRDPSATIDNDDDINDEEDQLVACLKKCDRA